jgi:electron transport complex protein RnfG
MARLMGERKVGGSSVTLVLWLVCSASGIAQTTREEALQQAFPGADIRAERVFLTEAQRTAAAGRAGVQIPTLLIARYVATEDGGVVGRAYVDTHVVRTKNASLLICLEPDGTVKRIEVTAFLEPPEYMASPAWYAQFEGRTLNDDLYLNRAIRPVAGATLTARATEEAVRRVLAIDSVLNDTIEVTR